MTITRAKKTHSTPARTDKAELTAEQFIAGAETPPTPSTPQVPIASAVPPAGRPSGRKRPEEAAPTFGHEAQALAVVRGHMPWAAGAGILPLPGVDLAAIIAVQLRMLAKLAETYDVPFKQQAAKSIVATLMATVLENTVAGGFASALKLIPGIGTLLGVAALPAVAAAGTYAVGKVFITHFEAGGTFLDFDPKQVEGHFRAEFEKARR